MMGLHLYLSVVFSLLLNITLSSSTDGVNLENSGIIDNYNVSNLSANYVTKEIDIANVTETADITVQHNVTLVSDEGLSQSKNVTRKVAKCSKLTEPIPENRCARSVEMVNATRLAKLLISDAAITNKDTEAECMAVLFFARVCQFSCQAAPQFNALARAFVDIKMVAMDSLKYHGINAQYGIVGVPTLKLFHNGKPIGKFNGTEYTLEAFTKFIKMYTNSNEEFTIVVAKDFDGPVPSLMEKESDYFLIMSWMFLIICGVYFFGQSKWWKNIVETVQNNWRESEAQHEHAE